MTSDSTVLLVPQKDLDLAKSRLALTASPRRRLAVAMLRRALGAAGAARCATVVVVLDNPDDEQVFTDLDVVTFHPGLRGLNPSLAAAEEAVRTRWGPVPLAVMPADLPLVTPELIDHFLRAAAPHERAFVADRSARGTTLLFAAAGVALCPAYGPGSASAHLDSGAHRIDEEALSPLRLDVDDIRDLEAASRQLRHGEGWRETA